MMSDEVSKLQTHLQLLRDEYIKLQRKTADLEKKMQALEGQKHDFVSKLLRFVSGLYNKPSHSDLKIKVDDHEIPGHCFVFNARSESWGIKEDSDSFVLDLSALPRDTTYALVRWVYTGNCEVIYESDEDFVMNLLSGADKFSLHELKSSCEQNLVSRVVSGNCLKYYRVAERVSASCLEQHCLQILSNYWDSFTREDFSELSAQTAYKMFKFKSGRPLHEAIRMNREDVVFLFMVEFNSQLPGLLNEADEQGDFAIDLALRNRYDGIATALVQHGVDLDRPDDLGRSLLHKAISRGDEFSAKFLIEGGCNVNASTKISKETPLHVAASRDSESVEMADGVCRIAELLIRNGCNINAQDGFKCTALHKAIKINNVGIFSILLKQPSLELDVQDVDGQTPLWLALSSKETTKNIVHDWSDSGYVVNSLASQLVSKGCSVNIANEDSGNSMLHSAALCCNELAGLFLISHGADLNVTNIQGETPLYISCRLRLPRLVEGLLDRGADANIRTVPALGCSLVPGASSLELPGGQTPLHAAARNGFEDVVEVVLNLCEFLGKPLKLELKDSQNDTPLGVALWSGHSNVAELLVSHGADVNGTDEEGASLLHQAINRKDTNSALFLINHKADINAKSPQGTTPLEMSIDEDLVEVADVLCSKGIDVNALDKDGDCILWKALNSQKLRIAETLVKSNCDVNFWSAGPGGCEQTLLHRAIDENKEDIASFLIKSKCNVNSPRRPGNDGDSGEEGRDGQGPLHLSSSWGLVKTVQNLIKANADINAKDAEGDTPLHIAIRSQHQDIIFFLLTDPAINLSLRNKRNQTPFSLAMTTWNYKAAYAIIERSPNAADQLDNKGRSFLHIAIESSDLESVLFLIGVGVNVNFRVQDSSQRTPLHISVTVGCEMILRNLLLTGAKINDANSQKQNSLHLAALHDRSTITSILIENQINCNAVDDSLNNAFHLACQSGHLNVVRVLLTQSNINITALNLRGQNPLHILGHYGKENAAAIFEFIMECFPQYPVDQVDINGDTALTLAYFSGNSALCKSLVKFGVKIGTVNKSGVSIFNAPVATKQLLFKLLDTLNREPPWCDGEYCLQCDGKFTLTTRKHHCRHCGRLLCAKCSIKDIPIIKFGLSKPVRVCDTCFGVLT